MSSFDPKAQSDPVPPWLTEPPAPFTLPPVLTQLQELPFEKLSWTDFERLVLCVTRAEPGVTECRVYGTAGQNQSGIDIIALLTGGRVACVQCKRHSKFGPDDISKAVEKFERGVWATRAVSFTLCVSSKLDRTECADAIARAHERLSKRGVEFYCWDASAASGLNDKLKALPELVEGFFGPGWVQPFNGGPPALGSTLVEAARVAVKLRHALQASFKDRGGDGAWGPLAQVERPEVDAQLSKAVKERHRRNIVVHGEEGTGKSTALSAWLQSFESGERWVLWAPAREAVEHASSVEELRTWLLARRLDMTEALAARLQQRCIGREPDLLIIDGVNERGEPGAWAKLLAEEGAAAGAQLMVVTRTEHLQRMRQALTTSEPPQESGLWVHEVVVPDFSEQQVRHLLLGMGEAIEHVSVYLRRPRLLQLAARHLQRLGALGNVTYATLQLLELESHSASPHAFLEDLADLVERESVRQKLPPDMLAALKELGAAQAASDFRLESWVEQHQAQAWLVIGLVLRDRLLGFDGQDVDAFIERIEMELGSGEFDARATVLEYATTAALLDARVPRAMRLALMDRWLECRNRERSPWGALARLMPLAPDDVLDGIERALSQDGEESLAVEVLLPALRGASRREVLRRASTWLCRVSLVHHWPQRGQHEDLAASVRQAHDTGWPVSSLPGRSSRPRSVALHLFLAYPEYFDRQAVAHAIASVAVNAGHRDGEVLPWALRRDERDHRGAFDQLAARAPSGAPWLSRLEGLRHDAYPDADTYARLKDRGVEAWSIWYRELRDQALRPGWSPAADDARLAQLAATGSSLFAHDRRGKTLQDHAFDDGRAALAIHHPQGLQRIVSEVVQRAVGPESNLEALRGLAPLGPLLTPSDMTALRRRSRELAPRVIAGDDDARDAVTALTELALHQQSPSRRLLTLARFMPEGSLTADLVKAVHPDAEQASWLARRLMRRPDDARRLGVILLHCVTFSDEALDSIRRWLRSVDIRGMSPGLRKNTLHLAWRVGADDVITRHALPKDGDEQPLLEGVQSLALGGPGRTKVWEVVQRSQPEHWAFWCERQFVGRQACAALALALAFVCRIESSLPSVLDAFGELDSSVPAERLASRLRELRESSTRLLQHSGQGLRYWATVIPEFVDLWLDASDEMLVGSFEAFSGLVEAAHAAGHPRSAELVARHWRLESRAQRYTQYGFVRASVARAFTVSGDAPEALWDEMLASVRDDAELLRLVTTAAKGAGVAWLRRTIDADRASAHELRRARAEVIAGMAGLASHRVRVATKNVYGWRERSAAFAHQLEDSRRWTSAWYRRFRLATLPSTRVGAWLNLVALVDVHFPEVLHDPELHYLDASRFYERTHWAELQAAVKSRQQQMSKTYLGVPLPSNHIGWLSDLQRRV